MAYNILKTDGTPLLDGDSNPVVIQNNTYLPAGAVGNTLDLTLYGKGKRDYGKDWNENFVRLLENFASSSAPSFPQDGMLWFDTGTTVLKFWNDTGSAWEELVTGGAGASLFVNVSGDTMTGDLNMRGDVVFTIPGSPLPDTSPGIVFTGNTDHARIYIEENAPESSILVLEMRDNTLDDGISIRSDMTTDTFPVEHLRFARTSANGPGIMYMTDDDGTAPMGTGANTSGIAQTIIFNEGNGNAVSGPDIRFNQSGVLSAGQHMIFNVEDGVSTTVPGAAKFYFNKDNSASGGTALASIENDGTFTCATDTGGQSGSTDADWFLGGATGTRIDFGTFNNAMRSLRACRYGGSLAAGYAALVRVEAADAVNNYDLVTKLQMDTAISGVTSAAVNRAINTASDNYTTPGQLITWNHNLGQYPYAITVAMQCLVADGGYSVGNIISMNLNGPTYNRDSGSGSSTNQDDGLALWHSSINQIQMRVGAGGLLYFNKSTGNVFNMSFASRWRFRFWALA